MAFVDRLRCAREGMIPDVRLLLLRPEVEREAMRAAVYPSTTGNPGWLRGPMPPFTPSDFDGRELRPADAHVGKALCRSSIAVGRRGRPLLPFVGVGECRGAARKAATRVGRSARVEGSCFQTPNLKAVSFR